MRPQALPASVLSTCARKPKCPARGGPTRRRLVQTARDAYRFEAQVPAGKTATQAVTGERNVGSSIPLADSPDVFLQSTGPRSRSSRPSPWTRRSRWPPS
jgi:hypothetical protein